ncbi:hypothetical protein BGZ54_002878, partial [Gamsiella multidivaricata]
CDLELGFRVQYSDIAMLSYVQLQVLDFQDNIVIENVDNSTRQEWDQHRAKNLTWSVPQDWSSGDYILRAFGGATYPCTENGQRKFCRLQLEDRQIIHLQPLPAGATCPVNAFPENTDPSTAESEDGSSNTSDGKESEGSLMDMFDVDRSEVLRLLGEKVGGCDGEGGDDDVVDGIWTDVRRFGAETGAGANESCGEREVGDGWKVERGEWCGVDDRGSAVLGVQYKSPEPYYTETNYGLFQKCSTLTDDCRRFPLKKWGDCDHDKGSDRWVNLCLEWRLAAGMSVVAAIVGLWVLAGLGTVLYTGERWRAHGWKHILGLIGIFDVKK